MVFANQGFLDVAIESWPEWQLNPRPLTSVLPQFQLFFSVSDFFSAIVFVTRYIFFNLILLEVITHTYIYKHIPDHICLR